MIRKSLSKGPVWGAAAGRSATPTAMVTRKSETTKLSAPAQVIQATLSKVWIEAKRKTKMVATATKTAVQVPCKDMALKAMEMDKRAEPATVVIPERRAGRVSGDVRRARMRSRLTEPIDGSADVSSGLAEDDITNIGNRVHFGVSVLELAHLVGSVCNRNDRTKISAILGAHRSRFDSQVHRTAITTKTIRPGTRPKVWKVAGSDNTPKPTCAFIIKTAAPIQPT